MNNAIHIPVMLKEVIAFLNPKPNLTYIDCTLGSGGHSQALLEVCPKIKLFAFDQDKQAIERCKASKVFNADNVYLIHDNFVNLYQHLKKLNIQQIDGFLFDLGVSSEQLDDNIRGFSYRQDSPLDMRMNTQSRLTAQKVINKYKCKDLEDIFANYGEEPKAKKIAKRICQVREKEKITTTQQLVRIVASCFLQKSNKHPARRVFQALRILVNQELTNLTQALKEAIQHLSKGGKVVVISYHSLEDRIVKHLFKKYASIGSNYLFNLDNSDNRKEFQIVTKKPLTTTAKEIASNHRSRSAKMRVLVRLK